MKTIISMIDNRINEYKKILQEAALNLGKLQDLQNSSDLQTQILVKTIQLPELKERVNCYGTVVRDLIKIREAFANTNL